MNLLHTIAGALVAAALACAPAFAQADMLMTAAGRHQLVEAVIKEVDDNYVFPDKAKLVGARLRAQYQSGAYERAAGARQLAEMLTQELQATTGDRHLRVTYSEQPIPASKPNAAPSADEQARRLTMMRSANFGVRKIEHLPFNIGYLELEGFMSARDAAETLGAAMTVLAHTDALIIDLRNNGGGDAAAVTLLAGYLLDKPTHLSDFYYRAGNRIEPRWSADAVSGLRYGQKKDVYVLTSKDSFSAAEDFTYALKNLKRVTVVGETTGGGAHPGADRRLLPHFTAFVPLGRSISPITKTNWEGAGVTPDIKVCAGDALRTAQAAILAKMAASGTDGVTLGYLQERIAALGPAPAPSPGCR